MYNTMRAEISNLELKITTSLEEQGISQALSTLKTLGLKTEKVSVQFDALQRQVKATESQIADMQEMAHGPFSNLLHGESTMVDDTAISDLREVVTELKKNFAKMKTDVYRSLKEQESKLLKKADEDVVNDLEEALHEGIDQVMSSSAKKFADRRDTNKAIRLLEQNMKNMYDLFVSRDDANDIDDAMAARKQLGFTCLSCQKGLVNLEGKKADCLYNFNIKKLARYH